MKNTYIIESDKPSKLGLHDETLDYAPSFGFDLFDRNRNFKHNPVHLYIISDEEIKEGDWVIETLNKVKFKVKNSENDYTNTTFKKIILTTDGYLIKDGIQDINDSYNGYFLEWLVKDGQYQGYTDYRFNEIQTFQKEIGIEYDENGIRPMSKNIPWYKIVIPEEIPIGDFIIQNAKATQGLDGSYYHYSEVCKLLRLYEKSLKVKE